MATQPATHDVIIVGARVAGSATAMLLARNGLDVLVVDRAAFPSDTLSTHQIQVPGGAHLRRWGLLDRITASGAPPARHLRFDQGPVILDGHFPEQDGVDGVHSPRRTVLDKVLVDAARDAGADVRERFSVDEILFDGDRVVGVRGQDRGGASIVETAQVVIGADGKHSKVAAAVGAGTYHVCPPLSVACYTYWQDVALDGGEMYSRDRRAIGLWPTNDGLVMSYLAWPAGDDAGFRADLERGVHETFGLVDGLGERLRSGTRVERFRVTRDLPNFFRVASGPGWALVGDAGLALDPITGRGITYAFRHAELLADALTTGLDGSRPLHDNLADYQRVRDAETLPMYEFTTQLASFAPPTIEQQVLFSALAQSQHETNRFFGVLTGTTTLPDYMTPRNLRKIIGMRGFSRIALAKLRTRNPPPSGRLQGPRPVAGRALA